MEGGGVIFLSAVRAGARSGLCVGPIYTYMYSLGGRGEGRGQRITADLLLCYVSAGSFTCSPLIVESHTRVPAHIRAQPHTNGLISYTVSIWPCTWVGGSQESADFGSVIMALL